MKSTSKTTNAPKLRFPEFTEDWEQCKLGDLLKYEQPTKYIVKSTNYDNSFQTPVLTAGQSFILGYTAETQGTKNASPKNPVIIFDDFTTSSHYVDFPFKIKSSAMKILSTIDDDLNSVFVFHVLKNIKYQPTNHERHWISIFSKFDVMLPTKSEQTTIGNFFRQIDGLITLHQRKLDKVKTLKKGLLQKMFPAQGETVPQIRFPQFTGDWEQRKLGDCFSERSERSSDGELISVTINLGVIKANELDRKDNSSQDKSNYKKVEIDDIAYNSMRMWQGACGVSAYSGILSPAYTVLKPRKGINSEFFAYSFKLERTLYLFKMYSQGLTSDTWNLKYPLLKDISTYAPSYEEQTTIGNFFRQFDDLINLHQRKLEHLKMLKKALLQQMFV